MPKPLELGVAAETKTFARDIDRGVVKPLDDVQEKLEAVAKEGDTTGGSLEDSMKQAQTATEKFQEALKDGSAPKTFKKNTTEAVDSAKTGMGEVKDEAIANASETVSSFDGSMESIVGGIQGTFGGLVSGLGPLGAAAGAAGAIGIGLITSAMEKSAEEAQEFREHVGDLTDKMIDAGDKGVVAFEDIADAIRTMATETDEAETDLHDLAKRAEDSGTDFATLVSAFSGAPDALKAVEDQLRANLSAYQDQNGEWANQDLAYTTAAGMQAASQQQLLKDIEATSAEYEAAAENERLWLQSDGPKYEAKAELIGSIDAAYDDAASAVGDFIDDETGIFDTKKYIKAMDERSKSLEGYQENLIKADLPPEVLSFLNSQGAEVSSTMVAGYLKESPANKKKLLAIWSEAGDEASGVLDDKVTTVTDKAYDGPTLKPNFDSEKLFSQIQRSLDTKTFTVKTQAKVTLQRNGTFTP